MLWLQGRFTLIGPAYSFANYSILPLISYGLVLITTAYSIGFEPSILSGLPLGRVVCVPSGQRLNVGLCPTVGAVFSAMKTINYYVVVAEQAHPFRPSLFISLPTFYFMGLCMLLLLHAIIPCLHAWIEFIFVSIVSLLLSCMHNLHVVYYLHT